MEETQNEQQEFEADATIIYYVTPTHKHPW